jgi:hypothetical protein
MKKILSVILFTFLLGNVFCQIKEIGCNGGTTTLQKIADTVNSNFDYIDTEITDTIPLSGLVYTKSQTDSICNAKIDSALTDVSTDTTYRDLVIDSLKTRITILEDSLVTQHNFNNWVAVQLSSLWDSLGKTAPIIDAVAPLFDSAYVANADPDMLIVILDTNDLHQDSLPDDEDFYLTQNGVELDITTVDINQDSLKLSLASSVTYGTTLLLDYTSSINALQDSSGNKVANWVDQPVTNSIASTHSYTDDFNSYSNGASLGGQGNWVTALGTMTTSGTNVYSNAVGRNMVYYNATTGNDQYSQVAHNAASSSRFVGAAVRISSASGGSGYFYYYGNGSRVVGKMVNGTWTQIATCSCNITAGQILRIEVQGTTIRCYLNGVLDTNLTGGTGTFTDTSLSTGFSGVCGMDASSTPRIDDWAGGDL